MNMTPQKNKLVTLRLNHALYAELESRAQNLNLSKSEYLRQSIMQSTIKPVADTRKIGECIAQLNYMNTRLDSLAEYIQQDMNLKSITAKRILDQLLLIKVQMEKISCMPK